MYVFVCLLISLCLSLSAYMCMYVSLLVSLCAAFCLLVCGGVPACACMCIYVHVSMYMYLYVCVCVLVSSLSWYTLMTSGLQEYNNIAGLFTHYVTFAEQFR